MIAHDTIRRPAVAGMFYPGTKEELESEVGRLLDAASAQPSAKKEGVLTGLIVPHAGYMYSGATAARAYHLAKGADIETCILIGPSHQEYFMGVSVYPGAAYVTPLGEAPIDQDLRDKLLSHSPLIQEAAEGHRAEHSLEVQLPFLQTVLPEAKIVPLVMGDQESETCWELGTIVADASRGKKVLLVASSDLSHFYPSTVARTKDQEVLSLIGAFDIRGLLTQLESGSCEACGGGPIAAVMSAAQELGATRATIVHACNSGDITGDTSRVVGYCSAALWR
ncbi:MAG: AmmeMemoRadiSam system protein B [Acidobacteriota bacterium]